MPNDIFQGADKEEIAQRQKFLILFFLQAARKRVRLARRRMDTTNLTGTEIKVLKTLLAETQDILTTRTALGSERGAR